MTRHIRLGWALGTTLLFGMVCIAAAQQAASQTAPRGQAGAAAQAGQQPAAQQAAAQPLPRCGSATGGGQGGQQRGQAAAPQATPQVAPQAAPAAGAGFPPLFFSEAWKREAGFVGGGNTPIDPAVVVTNPALQLRVCGPDAAGLNIAGNAASETGPVNLWTGLSTGPVVATLRHKNNYVDLTGLAKMRWTIRTSGFHQIRPVVKLADGTWLVGDHANSSTTTYMQFEFAFLGIRWARLDPDRGVTVGSYGQSREASVLIPTPDLSRVDEVGFADLMPSSGHGAGAWANIAKIEVFGVPVPR